MESKKIILIIMINVIAGIIATSNFSWAKYIDEPQACVSKKIYPCTARFLNNEKQNIGVALIFPKKFFTVVFFDSNTYQVIEGAALLRSFENIRVQTPYFTFQSKGDIWAERQRDNNILLRNLDANVKIVGAKLIAESELPIGFENWYSSMNSKLTVEQGVMRPIKKDEVTLDLLQALSWNKKTAQECILNYKEKWKDSVTTSSALYQQVIDRRMASIEHKKEKNEIRREEKRKQEKKMRDMFRARFYNEWR